VAKPCGDRDQEDFPAATLAEFIAFAKKNPAKVNIGMPVIVNY